VLSWLSLPPARVQGEQDAWTASKLAGRPLPVFWFSDGAAPAGTTGPTPAEMALAMIEMDLGAGIARRIANGFNPMGLDRLESGSDNLNVSTSSDKIRDAARWIRENFGGDVTIAGAAEVAAMSNRNFLRRFKAEFGVAPLEYLMRTRCDLICRLLVETDLPVDKIARRCGMGNGDRMGRLFRRRYGASPTEYRVRTRAHLTEQTSEHVANYASRSARPR
jgi:transcriptional regulator GlxA family with amidase domain